MKLDTITITKDVIILDNDMEKEAFWLWLKAYMVSTTTPEKELLECYNKLKPIYEPS